MIPGGVKIEARPQQQPHARPVPGQDPVDGEDDDKKDQELRGAKQHAELPSGTRPTALAGRGTWLIKRKNSSVNGRFRDASRPRQAGQMRRDSARRSERYSSTSS